MKKRLFTGIALAAALTLAGCGNSDTTKKETAKADTQTHYPVTIHNVKAPEGGGKWEKKDQVFKAAPKRIMANTRPAAELLLRLGLGDKIVGVGADFGAPDKTVSKAYKKLKILSDQYVGKEVTLGTNPDLVLGRGGLFDNTDWGVGTVDTLNDMGIHTYVLESSIKGGTYDTIYQDIDNIGQIFNMQDKANSFKKELQTKEQNIEHKLASIKENKTFAYLHMFDPENISVYPANDETFFNDAFKKIKMDNVFKQEKGEVSVETLIKTNPDVLIIPKMTEDSPKKADKIIQSLYKNPKLSSMKAIKNKQVYAVDYNYLFGYGYTTIDGMEMLAKEMYPELFK